ncbi:uncharacterized protein LODBEIA_P10020 [Lodderomyces beijingensis]|uniref:Karyogamy protein KAR4 n=1 Tax=Lodderomyces beijingensis TaxID=1775926 RepID=A0ABP0ZF49_9ASCO
MYTYNKFGSRAAPPATATASASATTTATPSVAKQSYSSKASTMKSRLSGNERSHKEEKLESSVVATPIDYTNHYIHTGEYSTKFIRNVANPLDGYPKLDKLHHLKKAQIQKHATKPYGVRCSTDKIIPTLNSWIEKHDLKFDVIMIGALVENQFILPVLNKLPIHKLCSKPGFLFIWSTTQKIQELTKLLNTDNFNKKFRRSEELIFLPINDKSPYYPSQTDSSTEKSILEKQQWHCWMCITGTVRRSTDNDLIHCNIDTDLQIESPTKSEPASPASPEGRNACPPQIYKVAENFSNSNRRLHLIPSHLGFNTHVKLRPGWVIMGPDVYINNFNPEMYKQELGQKSLVKCKTISGPNNNANTNMTTQYLVPQTNEIEDMRPKSPIVSVKGG